MEGLDRLGVDYSRRYTRIDSRDMDYWVVRMVEDGKFYVVDYTGNLAEEPVHAGPFDTVEEARSVAIMLHKMSPVGKGRYGLHWCNP